MKLDESKAVPAWRSLARVLSGSAGLRLCGMFFGFLVGVQVARALGASAYGIYGTAMAILSLLMLPTEFGLPLLVTREVAAATAAPGAGTIRAIVSWARARVFLSSVVIALAAAVFLISGAHNIDGDLRLTLLVGLFWIPIVAQGNVYGAALRGLHELVRGQLGEFLIRPAIVSASIFILVSIDKEKISPWVVMVVNIVAACAGAITASLMLFKQLKSRGLLNKGNIPAALSFASVVPLGMSEGLRIIASQVGILILALLAPPEQVGQYRVAYQIYVAMTMPSALVNIACAPSIATLYSQGRIPEINALNRWISMFLVGSTLAFLALTTAFGDWFVPSLFGDSFFQAAFLLKIFLLGDVIVAIFGHPIVVLNMARSARAVMVWSAIALIVTAGLIAFLTPIFGVAGAVLGTSAGLIVWNAGCAFYALRNLNIETSGLMRVLKSFK